jgi:DNA gyrase subunit A
MSDATDRVIPVAIEDEVRESYLNYAMSVIVSRALPDVRDGLKPVHRRLLYAMSEMGLRADRPYKKSARIVGDTMGKYHPHGNSAIYEALARLAQDFSLRYPVVDGQGNFGSADGDPPAADRYTEARLGRLAEEMLRDIAKETVDFGPNYDDSLQMPLVLPAAFPYLLCNGASGIAVGMATNIPPHNLTEISEALCLLIDAPESTVDDLARVVKGPDFPTGGLIFGKTGIRSAYRTGRGRVVQRARVSLETTKQGRENIVVTELPYQVIRSTLMVHIADLVREDRIDGIVGLRDESNRNGTRVVIELKRGVAPKVVLNQLFSHTELQVAFNVNALALVHGRPRLLNLREMLQAFVDHRQEVVTRRTRFDLRKAEEREHILIGLRIALENIDEVIAIIKASDSVDAARRSLIERFALSEVQAQAILDMRLQRLTSLETRKILEELEQIRRLIAELRDLLSSEAKILGVVKEEVQQIAETYGDPRRTEIVAEEAEEIDVEDLILREDMVVLISNRGLVKRVASSVYRRQSRGGRGSSASKLAAEDFIEHVFVASTHDYVLLVTSAGRAFWLKVHELPESSRASRGQSVRMLLPLTENEEITTVLTLKEFSAQTCVFMATSRGVVKRVSTTDFGNARTRGIVAIRLDPGDRLMAARLTSDEDEIMLVTRAGQALRFHVGAVRAMGRASRGVTGIRLSDGDEVCGVVTVSAEASMTIITQRGFGKRVEYANFSPHGRGTHGQSCYKPTEQTGEIVGALSVDHRDDLVCITSQGNLIKLRLKEIPVQGKTARGVRVVHLSAPDVVVGIAKAEREEAQGGAETEGVAAEDPEAQAEEPPTDPQTAD